MEINVTLIGQLITFAVFVWFTMKFVWPPLLRAMKEREQHIAEGLAAAERGQRSLELAQQKANEQLQQAKQQAVEIVEQANRRASQMAEESKQQIKQEGARLLSIAQANIQQEWQTAQERLRVEAANLAAMMAEKVLKQALNKREIQQALVKQSLEEI